MNTASVSYKVLSNCKENVDKLTTPPQTLLFPSSVALSMTLFYQFESYKPGPEATFPSGPLWVCILTRARIHALTYMRTPAHTGRLVSRTTGGLAD